MQCAKPGSTLRSSRAPPHLSTNQALRRLTSEVGRDPVRSRRYGRQRFRVAGAPRERFVAQWGRRRDRKSTAAPGRNPCRNIACCQLRVALGPKQTVLQKRCAPSASFTPPKLARQRACGRETVNKRGCVLRSGLRRSPVASWGPRGPQQFGASHSRQLLVKDERLVRYGVCAAGPRRARLFR